SEVGEEPGAGEGGRGQRGGGALEEHGGLRDGGGGDRARGGRLPGGLAAGAQREARVEAHGEARGGEVDAPVGRGAGERHAVGLRGVEVQRGRLVEGRDLEVQGGVRDDAAGGDGLLRVLLRRGDGGRFRRAEAQRGA